MMIGYLPVLPAAADFPFAFFEAGGFLHAGMTPFDVRMSMDALISVWMSWQTADFDAGVGRSGVAWCYSGGEQTRNKI